MHLPCKLAEAYTIKHITQSMPFCSDRSTRGQGVLWPLLPSPWTWQKGFLSLSRSYLRGLPTIVSVMHVVMCSWQSSMFVTQSHPWSWARNINTITEKLDANILLGGTVEVTQRTWVINGQSGVRDGSSLLRILDIVPKLYKHHL